MIHCRTKFFFASNERARGVLHCVIAPPKHVKMFQFVIDKDKNVVKTCCSSHQSGSNHHKTLAGAREISEKRSFPPRRYWTCEQKQEKTKKINRNQKQTNKRHCLSYVQGPNYGPSSLRSGTPEVSHEQLQDPTSVMLCAITIVFLISRRAQQLINCSRQSDMCKQIKPGGRKQSMQTVQRNIAPLQYFFYSTCCGQDTWSLLQR